MPGARHPRGHWVLHPAAGAQPVHPIQLFPGLHRERADRFPVPGVPGVFSGESLFFLLAYSERGDGAVFYNSYGAIKRLPVEPGKELVVDTGHLVAFSDDVEYSIGKVGGIRSLIGGGEGLVMKFRGDGQVWIQTRNLASLVEKIVPFLPTPNRGQ